MNLVDKKINQLKDISKDLENTINDLVEMSKEYREDENGIIRNEKGQVTAESLGFYTKKSALADLKDPWVFHSVADFIRLCDGGGITPDDGSSRLLLLDKRTFQVVAGGSACGEDVTYSNWNKLKGDEHGVPEKTIKHVINQFSDYNYQLLGVLWYNC